MTHGLHSNMNDANDQLEQNLYEEVHETIEQTGLFSHRIVHDEEILENTSETELKNQIAGIEEIETRKNLFEVRASKMNERYFSNSEEDEIKDCDFENDEEEENTEKDLKKEDFDLENREASFYDNNYWKSTLVSKDVLRELDLDTI